MFDRLVAVALRRYDKCTKSGLDAVAAWNDSSVDWTVAARVRDHMILT